MENNHFYIAIDLKSFYASVECVERGLDPLTTNLVVADETRTEKTICLAVSPALKTFNISGRARLFEVNQRVREVNNNRRRALPDRKFIGKSNNINELEKCPEKELGFIIAPPRMALYIEYSLRIYDIYMKYIAPEDMHVYSIDEVFIDVTHYLKVYGLSPKELAKNIINDVLCSTGITATAGIGTNLYLCKVAMDIEAKHIEPDCDGVRIAELDEISYRKKLWDHMPITDFWRVGRGYARKLEENGMLTMGDVAKCSVGKSTDYYNEDLLYRLFGINAELLIDHAWGYEPVTIADIRAYRPASNSISSGQVLKYPYGYDAARLVVQEMTDMLALDLVDKRMVTDQIVLTIGYDIENLSKPEIAKKYRGEITTDAYGRKVPKHSHGTCSLSKYTSSTRLIMQAVLDLYDRIVNQNLLVRRITIAANHLENETLMKKTSSFEQMNLFTDYEKLEKDNEKEKKELERERKMQEALLSVKKKFGKNAVVKGISLKEGATSIERNSQIGGHRA